MNDTRRFCAARDFLLKTRDDYEKAYQEFHWPELSDFNWAFDWFDVYAKDNRKTALWLIDGKGVHSKLSFSELSTRSSLVALFLQSHGIGRGDRILAMLPNVVPLWELTLAALKLGAVLVPTSMQAAPHDIKDRVMRGHIRMVVTVLPASSHFEEFSFLKKCLVGSRRTGWLSYDEALNTKLSALSRPKTSVHDPFLLYFTSGTTALPKLVLHTQYSYPVGHLSTMYWIGISEGDIHQNISSPGWAKHAWSSLFAPWNAGATVLVHETPRFSAGAELSLLTNCGVNSLCAPPTVWRMMILEELSKRPPKLRDCVSAGEPLNPEVIEHVKKAWGITIRDGYGQTETTAQIGNSPGQEVRLGSMGRPLPGYSAMVIDGEGNQQYQGEIALRLNPRPGGLMVGYADDEIRTQKATADGLYRTGDEATVDDDGYFHFVGRKDDVFKSSDYRISPFELESVLLEHELVAEAAIVPALDPVRLYVPKAYVTLTPGTTPHAKTAQNILMITNAKLAPYQRIRRLEFVVLPKTISGKIRRVKLRQQEEKRHLEKTRGAEEYWLDELVG